MLEAPWKNNPAPNHYQKDSDMGITTLAASRMQESIEKQRSILKSQGSSTRPRSKGCSYFGDLESRTFDAKPQTAFSGLSDYRQSGKGSAVSSR